MKKKRNGKGHLLSVFIILSMLLVMIPTTVQVRGETVSKTIDITSIGIKSLVCFTTEPDDESQKIEDFFVDEVTPVHKTTTNNRYDDTIFIQIEPDFFSGGRITSIKINGESKIVTAPTGRNVFSVDSSCKAYNIEITGVAEKHYNIMWANSGAHVEGTDYNSPEVLLKNGSAKIIKVYDNEKDMKDITKEIEHSDEGCIDPQGKGFVSLSEGNVVIFEFVPEYGYQLTSVSANGMKLEAQETMNQYKYIMPATNIHFQATFTKTEDIVKSSTQKVKGGTIKIDEKEIDAGSAILSIQDATLTDEQKTNIQSQASDYSLSHILDIKLDQVFYKGNSNSDDVWSNSLGSEQELEKPATITLNLEGSVKGDDVVLIHEKHDGTYEIIETIYDASTNTLSFETKGFSNYAIAYKTKINKDENKGNSQNKDIVETSDTSIPFAYIGLLGLSITGMYLMSKKKYS